MYHDKGQTTASDSVAYINGHVYTVDKARPWAQAFIVDTDGKFTMVGSTHEIEVHAKTFSMVIYDLKGNFVMPGIHDAHVHTVISGSSLLNWLHVGMDVDKNNIVDRIKGSACSCTYSHVYEDWVFGGGGFGFANFDRSILDEEYPETPVVILGGGCHSWYANTAALQRAGYDVDGGEEDPVGGKHELRPDGSLTGALKDQAGNRLMAALPKPPKAHIKRVILRAVREMHRHGITSCQDAAATEAFLVGLSDLEREQSLKMHFSTHCLYKNEWLTGEVQSPADRLIMSAERYQSKHVSTGFVKMMMDGACVPDLMSHSDVDEAGNPDASQLLLPDISELIRRFDAEGICCKIHCMGYGGTKAALDAYQVLRERQPHGPRHEIAHCTRVLEEDFPRFKKLNVTAEMSPAMSFDNAGNDYLKLMKHDFNGMLSRGAHVTIGSDWAQGIELPMLRNVAVVARAIGPEKVLEMITLAGAVATGRDHEAGSIETGKLANFICIDKDLTRSDFANARVLKTWFEGELVYESSEEVSQ